ncbi:hypothetical protein CHS0354_043159 [Potamilus streckersoni]|uniref:Protein timeless homolog n=1 Tax=Potamilus streckersoni TaxID=2493646 RepID=A0AAE0VY85_9BIVA|nr:hypothetical protein CHS0354_043159 [Potamilus streckersoni]
MVMLVELQATCSALGYQEGDKYVREPDCLETVKDLIRFLKREDDCDIRRQLGDAQIVQNDLLPILKQYDDEADLWEATVRLLVNLTQPAVLCFNNHIPEEKTMRNYYMEVETHLQTYKEAFASEDVFAVIAKKLGDLLKLDWENRQEEDRLLIERILILIRNVLHVPPNLAAEQRTDDDASIHDQVLWAMHVSGLEDLLLYIASSEDERQYAMHILEIVSLMFREQNPDILASAGVGRSMTEKEKDERELEIIRQEEFAQKRSDMLKFNTRHSRFGGTYVVRNMTSISERELIYHKSQGDVKNINLDMNKKPKKKPKNRKPIKEQELIRRSTLSIRLSLKEFCIQFLENCYNPLMYTVKNLLSHEKTQDHDETYYLWAMRFFMEFCRLHSKQVDLVSETMSVPTFHYIQVQLFSYYEMIMMEKKEAIIWGNRAHLALKAYQELLMTLDSMDRSGNPQLMESSRIIKSNIFYMMEFRDIFLTMLRRFDENRQSRSYLKDLIETTHLFLKMLEHFSKKTKHLVVEKKKRKKGGRKKKPESKGSNQPSEPTAQEIEDLWDEVSSELSAIFQGRAEIPQNVSPFDAASEVDINEQRVDAMIRIQDMLREKKPGEAVALFRAAREVWPERNEFGTPDISPEDEFMCLREIFMTSLPRPMTEIPEVNEQEEVEQEEDEQEEVAEVEKAEQEFDFKDFVMKFARPEILKPYVILLGDVKKNSTHTNHCIVKMMHRIAVDFKCLGMMFQASLFRIFQQILLSPLAKTDRFKEIAKFATFVVRHFVETAQKNPKVYMELLFWKSCKDGYEILEGYGTYSRIKAKVLWTEDLEQEVRRLYEEYVEQDTEGKDVVDCIAERITDPTKTRGQIIQELKRQSLITSAKDLRKPKGNTRLGPWKEDHEVELRELFDRFKTSSDPVGNIVSNMSIKRSKAKVIEKVLQLGLVEDRKQLYKKRSHKSRKGGNNYEDDDDDLNDRGNNEQEFQELPSDFEEPELPESSDDNGDDNGDDDSSSDESDSDVEKEAESFAEILGVISEGNMSSTIRSLVEKGYRDQIHWIERALRRTAEDRESEESVAVPIVPLTEENETAMEDEIFLSFLSTIGISAPANEQEAFWRIPANLTASELRNIADGLELNENGEPVAADKIKVVQKPKQNTQKKRKEKKKERKKDKHKNKKDQDVSRRFAALQAMAKKRKEDETQGKRRSRYKKASPIKMPDIDQPRDVNESMIVDVAIPTPAKEKSVVRSRKKRVKKMMDSDDEESQQERPGPVCSDSEEIENQCSIQIQPLQFNSDSDSDENSLAIVKSSKMKSRQDLSNELDEQDILTAKSTSKKSRMLKSDNSDDDDVEFKISGSGATKRSRSLNKDDGDDQVKASPPTKRSRIILSDDSDEEKENIASQGNTEPLKFGDSDSEDDIPLSAVIEKRSAPESFPATLYTQPESDSDLDDHVPLRKVLQRKNVIDSDDNED